MNFPLISFLKQQKYPPLGFTSCSTKIGANAEVFATTSDTTGSMNLFGQMLEDMGIRHPCCSDHIFHLNCKKLYNDVTFEEGGLPNINSPSTCVKMARKLIMFFNKSTQAMAKLKPAQQLLSSVANNNVSDSGIVVLLQDVVTRWWSTHCMIKRLLELKDSGVLCFLLELVHVILMKIKRKPVNGN